MNCRESASPPDRKQGKAEMAQLQRHRHCQTRKHCNMCRMLSSIQGMTCKIWLDGASSLPYYAPHCTDCGERRDQEAEK
eukprot:gene797-biopygen4673